MKRIISLVALSLVLSVPVRGGDVPIGPCPECPPPCTQNCNAPTSISITSQILLIIKRLLG